VGLHVRAEILAGGCHGSRGHPDRASDQAGDEHEPDQSARSEKASPARHHAIGPWLAVTSSNHVWYVRPPTLSPIITRATNADPRSAVRLSSPIRRPSYHTSTRPELPAIATWTWTWCQEFLGTLVGLQTTCFATSLRIIRSPAALTKTVRTFAP